MGLAQSYLDSARGFVCLLLLILPILFFHTSCSDEESVTPVAFSAPEVDKVELQLVVRVKSPAAYGTTTRGETRSLQTDAESAVNSVTIFLASLDEEGKETTDPMTSQTLYISPDARTTLSAGASLNLTYTLQETPGTKHLYIGANMRESQIQSFCNHQDYTVTDEEIPEGNHQPVRAVMDIGSYEENVTGGAGSNIVMFAQEQGSVEIPNIAGTQDLTCTTQFQLERIVSKVLLAIKPNDKVSGGSDTYAYITLGEDTDPGWIRLQGVRYLLNTTNRKVRWLTDANHTDPNYDFSDFFRSEKDDSRLENISEEAYNEHFLHFNSEELGPTWNSLKTDVLFFNDMLRAQPVAYDEAKKDSYTEGLYCLENTVRYDSDENETLMDFEVDTYADAVTTYVVVGAQFTPNKIILAADVNSGSCHTYTNEADAISALNKELVDEDGDFNGTFWVDTDRNFYTSKAKSALLKSNNAYGHQLTKYEAGICYYQTYIDTGEDGSAERKTTETNGVISYKGRTTWGVWRNHYYLLVVDKFEGLGEPVPNRDFLQVYSQSLDWVDKGATSIEIKPSYE
jgi:hypothetical protein